MKTETNRKLGDNTLVQMYKEGNYEAFGIIFERYNDILKKFILTIIRNSMQAEDILQDVFLKALEQIKENKYIDKGILRGWLFTIAYNYSINFLKSRENKNLHFSTEKSEGVDKLNFNVCLPISSNKNPEDIMIRNENKYNIRKLIKKLPYKQKEIVILRIYHDLKFSEIEQYLNCPWSTNRVRMKHAIDNLKKQIHQI